MKFTAATALALVSSASAFAPTIVGSRQVSALAARDSNFDLSGNSWKPDSEKMGSTDVSGRGCSTVCCVGDLFAHGLL